MTHLADGVLRKRPELVENLTAFVAQPRTTGTVGAAGESCADLRPQGNGVLAAALY
jgi:hypothetical protein